MKADYVDIRYNGKNRRFRYPIKKSEFLTWLAVQGGVSIENLSLVGYQLPDKVITRFGKNLSVEKLLPVNQTQLAELSNYWGWRSTDIINF